MVWAIVETKNEPFVDFLILVCHTTEEKGKFLERGYREVKD